jgi:transcriptional regulator with XRE-family HTH domain
VDIPHIFGTNLKRLRYEAGLSQEDLMAVADVHRTQISKYERGASIPKPEVMLRLAKSMGVPTDAFFRGIEWQAEPPRLLIPPGPSK